MGSHSFTCHPTQVNAPRHNPSQPGRYSIYLPGGMEGWVDLGSPIAAGRESNLRPLDRKSDAIRVTPPSHPANKIRMHEEGAVVRV